MTNKTKQLKISAKIVVPLLMLFPWNVYAQGAVVALKRNVVNLDPIRTESVTGNAFVDCKSVSTAFERMQELTAQIEEKSKQLEAELLRCIERTASLPSIEMCLPDAMLSEDINRSIAEIDSLALPEFQEPESVLYYELRLASMLPRPSELGISVPFPVNLSKWTHLSAGQFFLSNNRSAFTPLEGSSTFFSTQVSFQRGVLQVQRTLSALERCSFDRVASRLYLDAHFTLRLQGFDPIRNANVDALRASAPLLFVLNSRSPEP
jgi:hypothetical protein